MENKIKNTMKVISKIETKASILLTVVSLIFTGFIYNGNLEITPLLIITIFMFCLSILPIFTGTKIETKSNIFSNSLKPSNEKMLHRNLIKVLYLKTFFIYSATLLFFIYLIFELWGR